MRLCQFDFVNMLVYEMMGQLLHLVYVKCIYSWAFVQTQGHCRVQYVSQKRSMCNLLSLGYFY